ncbi:hypothetical protein CLOP_g22267 [Closterium sp. NIES-67]|nr:hypothetical protein CLOP_g22267 [Closterium sp. NIES-67]
MLRRFKPQGAHMIPHISHMISASPLQRTNQPLATVHAATPAAVPAARCPLPPVEALRRAVKRSHAAAGLDEEVTSRPRAALPSNLPSHLPSNALAAGAAASGLPAVLPSDADVAERLVKYDRLTSSLRGSLPPANLAQWDKAVGKLRDRVAMKEEFGNDVNGFLLFLHAQLGAQQPSARKALQLFAAFKQAQRQKQNAGAAAMGTEVSAADSQRVSVKVQAPFRDYVSSDDDTTSVCSNHPEPAELIEARAEPQAGSTLPRLNSSGPVPSASGFQGEVCSQQRNVEQLRLGQPGAALGIDATCPAVAKKMLFELQSAVVQFGEKCCDGRGDQGGEPCRPADRAEPFIIAPRLCCPLGVDRY